jgi:hypothetical protein
MTIRSIVFLITIAALKFQTVQAATITTLNVAVTQNFETFAGTLATLPTGFAFTGNDYDPGGLYSNTGAYSNNNSTHALVDGLTGDRAFGERGPTSGSRFLNWTLTNGSGADISKFLVAWDVEQYSAAGRATTVNFNYRIGSSGPFITTGIVGTTLTTATTAATAANLATVLVTNRAIELELASALQQGQTITFGWSFNNGLGTGSNAHIGVDNLSVTAVPEPSSLALLGLIGAGGFAVRRIRRGKVSETAAIA